jgi:8-oxo-dGTP pyrophosphatase MutT (NUDIX family)
MFDIPAVAQALALYNPEDLSSRLTQYAAVAVILRPTPDNRVALGFIKRAFHEGDRWSGHVAFPGGKYEPSDADSLHTAVRETFEEVGITLVRDAHLGRLTDIQARNQSGMLPFYIRPHVFVLSEEPEIKLDEREVASFGWVDLEWFFHPAHKKTHVVNDSLGQRELPAYVMPDESTLWGLTHMITEELLALLGHFKKINP